MEKVGVQDESLWVTGKRNKQRTVPVASGVQDALADWLCLRGQLFRCVILARPDEDREEIY